MATPAEPIRLSVKRSSISLWILLCFYIAAMELSYYFFIVPNHGYNGYFFDFDTTRFIVAKLFFVLTIAFIHLFIHDRMLFGFSYLVLGLFLCPNLILYQYMNSPAFLFLGVSSLIFYVGILQHFTLRIKLPRFEREHQNKVLVIVGIILLLPFFYAFGLNLNFGLLNLETVYIFRKQMSDVGNIFTSYLYSWLSYWLFPFLILIGVSDRKKGLLYFALCGMLYLFFSTGNKITFFLVFAVVGFSLFNTVWKKIFYFYSFLSILFLLGLVGAFLFRFNFIQDFLVGRFLFLPSLLNIQYFEFFKGQKLMLSYSFLSPFYKYPYNDLPARLIGKRYYLPETNSTNGIIGDGYINFGVPGIFVFTFIAALIVVYASQMKLSDKFFGIYFILVLIFIESALFTSMLTHGLIFFLFLLTFVLKDSATNLNSARI